MPDIDSGADLKYRIVEVSILPNEATFKLSVGYYDSEEPPVWHSTGTQFFSVPAAEVLPIMMAQPAAGLSRREDMLTVWSQFFLTKGWIVGTLVPSL